MAISAAPIKGPPLLRVVSPEQLTAQIKAKDSAAANVTPTPEMDELAAYVRAQWDLMRNHRNSAAGWSERLTAALRAFNGQYDPSKLAAIKQFGGSEVYARMISVKCRGASALLREVYLGSEKSWGLEATPDPTLREDIMQDVVGLVQMELAEVARMGMPIDPNMIRDRVNGLMNSAKEAAKKRAREEARKSEDKLNDLLTEGGFYQALAEFLVDLPLFPFACMKGPVVRIVPDVVWQQGQAVVQQRPRMQWQRVSPFDIFWTPGVSRIENANVIEIERYTRTDLNELIGLPGYDETMVRAALQEYGRGGHREYPDGTDSERAINERREDPNFNRSEMIDCLNFNGNVQGRLLVEKGIGQGVVTDLDRDYFVQAWIVGRFPIKIQMSPSPRKRHPYYITSFEKVPGTPVGNALPDILADIQDVCNATLRSLVNNMSIASGPQVVVLADRVAQGENPQALFPWKRWMMNTDPSSGNAVPPVSFFQPKSNAQELLGVYKEFTNIADELSAIPRYLTGSDRTGGAGRTASGLAMIMGNASKVLQTVAANIDRDVIDPLLQGLYDMVMLTDQSGMFKGDEAIRVRGVEVAVQRETNRMRQIEFLTATANPFDLQIMGPGGRATVLRSVSKTIGLDGDEIVPDPDAIKAAQAAVRQSQGAGQPPTLDGGPMAPQEPGGPMQPGSAGQAGPVPVQPGSPALGAQDGAAMRGMA